MKKKSPDIEKSQQQALDDLIQKIGIYSRTEISANLGSWEWDVATDTVTWSDGLFRIFQLDPSEGAPSFTDQISLYHSADFECLRNAVNNAVTTGEPYEIELRALRKDGETRYCIARGFAEKEPNKQASRLYGILQDITTLKQMRNRLTENEELFRSVVERMTDMLTVIDFDGNFLLANNNAAKNLCNGKPEDVTGRNIREFVLSDSVEKLITDYRKVIQSNHPLEREVEVHLCGKQFFFINRLVPLVFGEDKKEAILSMSLDITDRKATEQVIVNNEKRFRNIFDSFALHTMEAERQAKLSMEKEKILAEMLDIAPNSITIHDTDGNFLFANQKTFTLHGYAKAEFMKINLHALDVPESESLLAERFRKIDQDGEARFDMQHFRKDKSSFPLEVYAKKIIWEGKNAVLSIATDITERKRIEEELRASEEKYRTVFENVNDVYFEAEVGGRLLEVSRSVEAFSKGQYRRSDVIGKPLQLFYAISEEREALYALMKNNKNIVDHEFSLQNRDMSVIRCSISANINYDQQGNPFKVCGIMRDITERKQAEEALRQSEKKFSKVFNLNPSACGLSDMETRQYVEVNEAFYKLFGYTKEEVIGKTAFDLGLLTPETYEIILKKSDSTGTVHNVEVDLIAKDGSIKQVLLSAETIVVNSKKHRFTVVHDITTLRRTETTLVNVQKLESLGLLAGGIAHDFNNLLGGIYGFLDMAIHLSKEEKVSQYLSKAASTIERARGLTSQLLTFAKGGAPIKKVQNLFPFVEETAHFALSGSTISLKVNVHDALWLCDIDKNQIEQVIENIVINAQQAMPVGGVVELSAQNISVPANEHPTLKAGSYVRLSIKDHGIGIQKELLNRIFEPFFTTKPKGHGLGLPTCYSIINRHNGYIDVQSEPARGTTFHIYLPATTDSTSLSLNKYVSNHSGAGVFIVMDDEEVIRETIGEMLKSFGYSVVLKENGRAVLDFLSSSDARAITISGMIFDLTVPGGMGGKETIHEIRKQYPEIAIFVSSGYAEDPVMANPATYGFSASISKPFMKADLTELLNKYMKNHKD